jgi:uncharacterized delta-60 repeat protein
MVIMRTRLVGRRGLALLLVLGAAVLFAAPANARPGDLDRNFGVNGKLLIDGGSSPADWAGDDAVASGDGVLISASLFRFAPGDVGPAAAVLKLREDGEVDPGFGDQGTAVLELTPGFFSPQTRLAVQPDGRIVLAISNFSPSGPETMLLARFLADGTPDPSFGVDGVADTGLRPPRGSSLGLALTSDGRIVIASQGESNGLLAARFLGDGSRDPTFSGDGIEVTQVRGGGGAHAVVVQPDGRILIAGTSAGREFEATGVVIRMLADGRLDPSFSGDGIVEKRFGSGGRAVIEDLALAPTGRILLVASREPKVGRIRAVVARLKPNGASDRSFADRGSWKSRPADTRDRTVLTTVAIQPNGRILVAGSEKKQLLVRRFRPSGKRDRSFSRDGRVTTAFASGRSTVNALALPADKLVAVGTRAVTSPRSSSSYLAAAGYLLR